MTLLTQAVIFAANAHDGATRKGSRTPYIVHPMEAAAIAAALTRDEEVIAAAALHDVAEDCGVSEEELAQRFGARVAQLVLCESQTQFPDPRTSWQQRKRETIDKLARGGRESKILALADKLSNMRAICRDYRREGDNVFSRFNQSDRRLHAWYYRSCAALIEPELGETDEWRELVRLIDEVFGKAQAGDPRAI